MSDFEPSRLDSVAGPQPTAEVDSDLWGPPPLQPGEDPVVYEGFRRRITDAVRPRDFIEEIYVRDVVDLTWEARRLRRLKAAFFERRALVAVKSAVLELFSGVERDMLARVRIDNSTGRDQFERLFSTIGRSRDAVMAEMLAANFEFAERIESAIEAVERRRDAVYREIARHRTTLGADLRRAVDEVEDADFAVVAPPTAMAAPE